MGNLEKLVVLTVFFLAGVVLAVSMNSTPPVEAGGATPAENLGLLANRSVDGSPTATAERDATLDPVSIEVPEEDLTPEQPIELAQAEPKTVVADDADSEQSAAPPLLSATGSVAAPEPGLLRDVEGLVATLSPHFASYTCSRDDTWSDLSRRFYGAPKFQQPLRMANPDVVVLTPGVQLMVPRDVRPIALRDTSTRPQPTRIAPEEGANAAEDVEDDVDGELGTEFREHTVARGETLSHIADKYYGSAVLWRRIWDANRDVVPDADRVPEGTVLRIP